MSTVEKRAALLHKISNTTCVMTGIQFCLSRFGHDRLMSIAPDSIDMEDDDECFFAQASGMSYSEAVLKYKVPEWIQVGCGFIGAIDAPSCDGDSRTEDLTPIAREQLREYQSRHRARA